MFTHKPRRLSPLNDRFSALSLAVATIVTCAVVGACRWLATILAIDSVELDGIVCIAVVYWVLSVVGYFTASSARARKQRRSGHRRAYPVNRVAGRVTRMDSGLQGSLP
jgi:hypothetical protein